MNGVRAPGGTIELIGDAMQRNGLHGVCDDQCVGMITCLHASVCASYLCYQSLFNDAIAIWLYSTYICILAPTACVLMMTFVICVHEQAAWTSRMTQIHGEAALFAAFMRNVQTTDSIYDFYCSAAYKEYDNRRQNRAKWQWRR